MPLKEYTPATTDAPEIIQSIFSIQMWEILTVFFLNLSHHTSSDIDPQWYEGNDKSDTQDLHEKVDGI
jgi:hypothetical protein